MCLIMNEKEIRKIANEEIDKRLEELTEEEGIVMVKTPLELKVEKEREEKDWIQEQM